MIDISYNPKTFFTLLGGVLALSASAIFVKLSDAPSAVTAFYRLFLAALALIPAFLLSKTSREDLHKLRRKQVLAILASGLLLAAHYVLWFESLRLTSVASSTILVSLQPLFSILFGVTFLKEHLRRSDVIGCLVAIAGSTVIGWGDFQGNGTALFGDLLAIAAAAIISLYFMIGQVSRRDLSAVTYSVLGYLTSAAFLFAYSLLRGESLFGYSATAWGSFFGLAFISTLGGQFVFNLLLKKLSATAVTMGILGEPIGTCILAYWLLGETLDARQLAGIFVILLGLSIYFFYPILRKEK